MAYRRSRNVSLALVTVASAVSTVIAMAAPSIAASAPAAVAPVGSPASLVNPLIGTGGDVSPGGGGGTNNTFPGPDVPFGMMQWGPDTAPSRPAGGGYSFADSQIQGFSLTHLSGPGCGAFGDVPILPTVGSLPANPSAVTEPFSHTTESAAANFYSVQTGSPAVRTDLTEAAHSAIGRFTFPATTQANLLLKLSGSQNGDSATSATVIGTNEIQGSVTSGHFCGGADVYTLHFDIVFDRPFTAHGTWTGNGANPNGAFLTFNTTANQVVQAKVGISFVSAANARLNWQADQPGFDFNGVRAAGVTAWNAELSKIQIGGGPTARETVFYTALYHALLHPNIFSDVNGQYIGFDNQIHTVQSGHVQVANYSSWDTYRSQAQLEAIVDPAMASNAAQSMVNDAVQNNGMLPKWALANGESYVMVGDPADGLLGGYYAFGARNFDTATALKLALAEATKPNNIRPGLNYYEQLGYVPTDGNIGCCNFNGPVSTTLEYAAADFALSNFAAALGDSADAAMLVNRSQHWQNLFNPVSGLIQAKTVSGAFVPATLTTKDSYVEGDASQYRWTVGWNLNGLVTAMGGNTAVNQRLDTFWTQLNDGPGSPFSFWDNQFEYAVPWAYDFTGAPWKAQQVVNRIRTQLYLNAPAALGDNDDLGATSSMGVLTMLGMFPEYISTADMVLASPEFPLEVIHLANGKAITINAPGASSASNFFVQSLTLNGQTWNTPFLPASAFTNGATLDFTVGATPNTGWAAATQDAPPSFGAGAAPALGFTSPNSLIQVQPGHSVTVTVGATDLTQVPRTITWQASPSTNLSVMPAAGTLNVGPGSSPTQTVTVSVAATAPQGFYTLPVSFTTGSVALPTAGPSIAVVGSGNTATTCTTLGTTNTNSGLQQNEGGDGTTTPVTVGGMSGRQTVPEVPNDLNMYFAVDPRIAFDGSFATTITITYFDTGTNTWSLQYDSTNPNGGPLQGAFTTGLTVTNQNTNTWKTATVTLGDARFAERQNNNSDFRIASSAPVTIHGVNVKVSGTGVLPISLC